MSQPMTPSDPTNPDRSPESVSGSEHGAVPFLSDRQRYSLRCLRDFARPRFTDPADRTRCDPALSWLDDLLDSPRHTAAATRPTRINWTTAPMTELEIAEARDVIDAATPGPWGWTDDFLWNADVDQGVIAHGQGVCWQISPGNRTFLERSRMLAARLLGEVERLTRVVKPLSMLAIQDHDARNRIREGWIQEETEWASERARLQAENRDLRISIASIAEIALGDRWNQHEFRAYRAAAKDVNTPFSIERVQAMFEENHDNPKAWCQRSAQECHERDEQLAIARRDAASATERVRSIEDDQDLTDAQRLKHERRANDLAAQVIDLRDELKGMRVHERRAAALEAQLAELRTELDRMHPIYEAAICCQHGTGCTVTGVLAGSPLPDVRPAFDVDEAERLAEEIATADSRATEAPWTVSESWQSNIHSPRRETIVQTLDVSNFESDSNAIAALRNNARSAATQLGAAAEEIRELRRRRGSP